VSYRTVGTCAFRLQVPVDRLYNPLVSVNRGSDSGPGSERKVVPRCLVRSGEVRDSPPRRVQRRTQNKTPFFVFRLRSLPLKFNLFFLVRKPQKSEVRKTKKHPVRHEVMDKRPGQEGQGGEVVGDVQNRLHAPKAGVGNIHLRVGSTFQHEPQAARSCASWSRGVVNHTGWDQRKKREGGFLLWNMPGFFLIIVEVSRAWFTRV